MPARLASFRAHAFLPSEIQPVSQKTNDAYVMLSFGQDEPIFGGVKVDGNIGLRYVNDPCPVDRLDRRADRSSRSVSTRPSPSAAPRRQRTPPPPPPGAPPGTAVRRPGGICLLGPANYAQLQQFANGATTPADDRDQQISLLAAEPELKFGCRAT